MNTVKRILYFFCTTCRPNKSRTVRYAFPLVVTALSFAGAALIFPENASFIRLESSVSSVSSGESFSIDVYATAHIPVNAISITLTFPTDTIAITGIDTGESVITIWTTEPSVEDGKVLLSGGTFRKGFIGEHLIATINAKALATGNAEFLAGDISLLAGDGSGTAVSVEDSGAESLVVAVDTTTVGQLTTISSTASVVIYTDIDGDGKVTMSDVLDFMGAWASRDLKYDFNGDNKMNFKDFGIILSDSFYK